MKMMAFLKIKNKNLKEILKIMNYLILIILKMKKKKKTNVSTNLKTDE